MSKRIVLRSVAVVAVLGFVVAFSSCKKEEEPKKEEPKEKVHEIVGVWKYQKNELKELSTTADPAKEIMLKAIIQQMLGEAGKSGDEVEFTKDGKVVFRDSSGEDGTGTYEIKGDKLTVIVDENVQTFDCSILGKTMYWNTEFDEETLEDLSLLASMFLEEEIEVTKCVLQTTLTKK
ncbi:MAG: hypothetical protein FWH36_06955 [Lentimicrobiaceae bacterium]|nr:hypothetical protein [Lentimicrobiaceae bacterium]